MNNLNSDIIAIKGVGPKRAALFHKMGIFTVEDLLLNFPRKYEDRSFICPIRLLTANRSSCIFCKISSSPIIFYSKNNVRIIKYDAKDPTGTITLLFFNQHYINPRLSVGKNFYMYGNVYQAGHRFYMSNPVFEAEDSEKFYTRRIVPIYKLTSSLSNREFNRVVKNCYEQYHTSIEEYLPEKILVQYNLCSASEAIKGIHFPESKSELKSATKRAAFGNLFRLFCLQYQLREIRRINSNISVADVDLDDFYNALPFSLTNSQRCVIREIYTDLRSGKVMARLVQGDVGSGKTTIAAAAIWVLCKSGYGCLLMAPTEILANQHYAKLKNIFDKFNIPVYLLTGSTCSSDKEKILMELSKELPYIIIGTHALIAESNQYPNLGLVVTDEQHRFGVEQRYALISKGIHPHALIMSATPIPRTLAMAIYGELDISTLSDLPPGRKPVNTYLVNSSYSERLCRFIHKIVEKGQQVYIVCARIGKILDNFSEEIQEYTTVIRTVYEVADDLRSRFPEYTVEYLHGKLSSDKKEDIMRQFISGVINILVSTTVIEVGVDVPNATLMIIENAEQYGLAQLHQLRGRIGRGGKESYCVLLSNTKSPESLVRMKALERNSDGMKISEEDLRLRGPGDFFGNRQHGLPTFNSITKYLSQSIINSAQKAATLVMSEDPNLKNAENHNLKLEIESLKNKLQ